VRTMCEQNFDQLLSGVVEGVLEAMFFSTPLGPAEPETGTGVLEAHVTFHGRPSGTLGVRLSRTSARTLAAGFLGEDEQALTDSQPGEVLCELANMLCGSLVSRLESDETFDLTSPELVSIERVPDAGSEALPAACQSVALEDGILTVTLHVEKAA
jgi:CheY-specific phosphatase CheX